MSDFLTRLAGRALQQTPVLAPRVPAWSSPLESSEPVLGEEDVSSRLAVAPAQHALNRLLDDAAPTVSGSVAWPGAAVARDTAVNTIAAPRLPAARSADMPVHVERVAVREAAATASATPAPAPGRQEHVAARAAVVQAAQVPQVRKRAASAADELEHEKHVAWPQAGSAQLETRGAQRNARLPTREPLGEIREQESAPVADAHEVADRRVEWEPAAPAQVVGPRREGEEADVGRPGGEGARRPRDITAPPGVTRPRHALDVEPGPPTITVSIGRIEVRAAPAPVRAPEPAPEPRSAPPRLSLDDYLAQRRGSAR
jgi:hypothetical protein